MRGMPEQPGKSSARSAALVSRRQWRVRAAALQCSRSRGDGLPGCCAHLLDLLAGGKGPAWQPRAVCRECGCSCRLPSLVTQVAGDLALWRCSETVEGRSRIYPAYTPAQFLL